MLILYLAFLAPAIFWVYKTLGPEFAKPALPDPLPKAQKPKFVEAPENTDTRVRKLETLVLEKNKNLQILQTELKVFHAQVRNFDKVKALMEEEIHRLREQNRIFRSELGLPPAQPKENLTV